MTKHSHAQGEIVLEAERLSDSLPPLMMAVDQLAQQMRHGHHGKRQAGRSEHFWEFRRYTAGDAVSSIDWRKSARSDKTYIRETEREAAQHVTLWGDQSPSMDFLSHPDFVTKRHRSIILQLALSLTLIRAGEHVSLGDNILRKMTSYASLLNTLPELEVEKKGYPPTSTNRLIMFGDFLDVEAEVFQNLIAQPENLCVVHLFDSAEEDLPYDGNVDFVCPETQMETAISDVNSIREDYRIAWRAHVSSLQAQVQNAGGTFLSHNTAHSPQWIMEQLCQFLAKATRS